MDEKMTTTPTPQRTSRLGIGLRNSGTGLGEIVEVQGGHIVRSTGRKDRHSKVCTAKGPRDRRVRLAAHTAIQFYDVQDRLGYDRPSKAVDWLIKKAKNAIDELAELPAWNPIITCSGAGNATLFQSQENDDDDDGNGDNDNDGKEQNQRINDLMIENEDTGFLPASLDSDAIADTIKSFFPVGANSSSSMQQFQSLPNQDVVQNQDLRLSLHPFQDPVMLHHHHHHSEHHQQQQSDSHAMLTGTPLGFHENNGGWQEQFQQQQQQQAADFSRFHRLGAWNGAAGGDASNGAAAAAGYMFNVPQQQQQTPLLQQLFSHNQFLTQRGPLQSNNTPSIRAWMDPVAMNIANAMTTDNNQHQHHQQQQHPLVMPMYPSTLSGIGFSSGVGGFSGFHVPSRIQGDEEEHDGFSDKPSSASSDSRH